MPPQFEHLVVGPPQPPPRKALPRHYGTPPPLTATIIPQPPIQLVAANGVGTRSRGAVRRVFRIKSPVSHPSLGSSCNSLGNSPEARTAWAPCSSGFPPAQHSLLAKRPGCTSEHAVHKTACGQACRGGIADIRKGNWCRQGVGRTNTPTHLVILLDSWLSWKPSWESW